LPRGRQSVPIFSKLRLLCPLPEQWQGHLPQLSRGLIPPAQIHYRHCVAGPIFIACAGANQLIYRGVVEYSFATS
jgi:hypothetical protein